MTYARFEQLPPVGELVDSLRVAVVEEEIVLREHRVALLDRRDAHVDAALRLADLDQALHVRAHVVEVLHRSREPLRHAVEELEDLVHLVRAHLVEVPAVRLLPAARLRAEREAQRLGEEEQRADAMARLQLLQRLLQVLQRERRERGKWEEEAPLGSATEQRECGKRRLL